MNHAAQNCVHAKLIGLAETHVLGEELVACGVIGILLVCSGAIALVRDTDTLRKDIGEVSNRLGRRVETQFRRYRLYKRVQKILEPAEGRIVLQHLTLRIEDIPGINLDWQYDAETGEVEGNDGCCGGNVLVCREVDDGVVCWNSEQRRRIWVERQLREQAKEILRVQLRSIKGSGNIDAPFDLDAVST